VAKLNLCPNIDKIPIKKEYAEIGGVPGTE
jgi:hypothetical protein